MKIMKTMLLACLLGGSAGTWAMEYKEEQKSQYDNSPRQQTTEIQKSKDGKNVTVFGRKTVYGFTAEELKAMPLVQALEKYDLDFTRVKRERVPEGTDLGKVLWFCLTSFSDTGDDIYTKNMGNIIVNSTCEVQEITLGKNLLGYASYGFYSGRFYYKPEFFSCNNLQSMNLVHALSKFFWSCGIKAYEDPGKQRAEMFSRLFCKIINPKVRIDFLEYSCASDDPLYDFYCSDYIKYEARHRGKFPQMHLPVAQRIIENFPLTVNIDNHVTAILPRVQDILYLAKERGFRPEIFCNELFLVHKTKPPKICIQEILSECLVEACDKKHNNPLYITNISFQEREWQDNWVQGIFESIPFLFQICGRKESDIFSIILLERGAEYDENTLSLLRPKIMQKAKDHNMVMDFFTEQSGKSRVTITPKKFFFVRSMQAMKSEIGKIYVKEDGTSRKQVFRKEVAWDVLRVCYSKNL